MFNAYPAVVEDPAMLRLILLIAFSMYLQTVNRCAVLQLVIELSLEME